MAFDGRGGAGQAVNLNHFAITAHKVSGILRSRFADANIVDALVGGVAFAVNVAVENHHRNAFAVHIFYYRSNGISLVRSHHNDVEPVIDKIAYVGYLFLVAVFG